MIPSSPSMTTACTRTGITPLVSSTQSTAGEVWIESVPPDNFFDVDHQFTAPIPPGMFLSDHNQSTAGNFFGSIPLENFSCPNLPGRVHGSIPPGNFSGSITPENFPNEFTGMIPSSTEHFSGSIPPENLLTQSTSPFFSSPTENVPATIPFIFGHQFTSQIPSSSFTRSAVNSFSVTPPFNFNHQFTGQIPSSFTRPALNSFSVTPPFNFYNQFTAQIPPPFSHVAENSFSVSPPFNFQDQLTGQIPYPFTHSFSVTPPFNFYNQFTGQIPPPFSHVAENSFSVSPPFNFHDQLTGQIPYPFTHAAEHSFSVSPSFNFHNQFTGQISSPFTNTAENNQFSDSVFASTVQLGNAMAANTVTAAADENNAMPPFNPNSQFTNFTPDPEKNFYNHNSQFNAFTSSPRNNFPDNPTLISVDVDNPNIGSAETQFPCSSTQRTKDSKSVLAQKRPREISFEMTNQILWNDNTEAENEYEYTGLLWDVVNFDPAPNKKKKVESWTEDEHKLFLIGLQKFGEGDWKSIATKVVVTKSPAQVASHAQKFFLRSRVPEQNRMRWSIHDITTVDPDSMARLLADRELPLQSPSFSCFSSPATSLPATPFSVNTMPLPPRPPPPSYPPSTPLPRPPRSPLQPPPVYDSSPIPSPVHYQSPPSPPSHPFSVYPPPSPWPKLAVYESPPLPV